MNAIVKPPVAAVTGPGRRRNVVSKIETKISLAPHIWNRVDQRARKHGISGSDEIRRILDWFFDEEDRKQGERIVVLDREQNMLRATR